MKEREREKPQLIITPEPLSPLHLAPPVVKYLGRFAQNSSMIKRHENDMLFTLLWYGSFRRGGWPNIWSVGGWKTCQNVAGFHEQLILFSPLIQVCQSGMCVVFRASER